MLMDNKYTDNLIQVGNPGPLRGQHAQDDASPGIQTNTARHSRDSFIQEIFASVAADIDFLSTFFSFGLDQGWRKRLVSHLELRGSEKVLDLCTGTGKLAFLLAERLQQGGSVLGIDFSREMLHEARGKLGSRTRNISFDFSDAKALTLADNYFDVVTVSFGMRNIPDTAAALRQAFRVLKPGGRFSCLELTPPHDPIVTPFYTVYCFKIMPFIAMQFLKTAAPYTYLPRSIKVFPPTREFTRTLEDCGFTQVTVHSMTFGIATIFQALKAV